MNRQSKILFTILIISTIISVSFTFYKTIIKGNFEIISDNSSSSTDNSIMDSTSTNL